MTYPILGNYFPSTYQKYVPQAFDNSLDLYEQMTAVIAFLNQIADNFNSLSHTTQGDLTTVAEVVNTLNDSLENFKSNLENEVLPTNLVAILEEWLNNGTLADLLTAFYENAGRAIEADYATGIWYEIGEWEANKVGAQMKMTFNGGAGYTQQAGGDGRLAVCGETILYVSQANNANPALPNAVAYAKHTGPSPAIAELKVVATNSARTLFKVFAKTQPYASCVGVHVQMGYGTFLKSMLDHVADPGAASSVVVSVPFEV